MSEMPESEGYPGTSFIDPFTDTKSYNNEVNQMLQETENKRR